MDRLEHPPRPGRVRRPLAVLGASKPQFAVTRADPHQQRRDRPGPPAGYRGLGGKLLASSTLVLIPSAEVSPLDKKKHPPFRITGTLLLTGDGTKIVAPTS